MKKKSLNPWKSLSALIKPVSLEMACLFWLIPGTFAVASQDMDSQFRLETVGCLQAWDNADGLFTEMISRSCTAYFSKQTRFVQNDLTKANSLLSGSNLPYQKMIQDQEILGQIAKVGRTDSLIRSQIIRKNGQFNVTLDWLHSPKMETLGSLTFQLPEPPQGVPLRPETIESEIQKNLGLLLDQISFLSYVSGRDGKSIILSLASSAKVKKDDTLILGTLEEVKKHPLLNTIVDWRMTPTGKVIVEQIEDGMAFCRIIQEEPGSQISRYQKLIQVQKRNANETIPEEKVESQVLTTPIETQSTEEVPRLGWAGVNLVAGNYGWNRSSGSSANSGGGMSLGTRVEGEVWFTREWFADLSFNYSYLNFTQTDTTTGNLSPASANGGVPASLFSYKWNIGYSYHLTPHLLSPQGWLKLGYKSNSYNLPISTTENTGPLSIGSVFLGMGGDLPLNSFWGIQANFNYRIFSSVTQTWNSSALSSNSDIELFLGGYYRFNAKMMFRGGLELVDTSVNFSQGNSIHQKTLTVAPALLYYF